MQAERAGEHERHARRTGIKTAQKAVTRILLAHPGETTGVLAYLAARGFSDPAEPAPGAEAAGTDIGKGSRSVAPASSSSGEPASRPALIHGSCSSTAPANVPGVGAVAVAPTVAAPGAAMRARARLWSSPSSSVPVVDVLEGLDDDAADGPPAEAGGSADEAVLSSCPLASARLEPLGVADFDDCDLTPPEVGKP